MIDPAPGEADRCPAPAPPAPIRRRPKRRHPALAARIVATGISTTAMLGIVATLGADAASEALPPPVSSLSAPAPPGSTPIPVPVFAQHEPVVVGVTEVTNEPIQLTANPVVQAAAPAAAQPQAAVAATNGSK